MQMPEPRAGDDLGAGIEHLWIRAPNWVGDLVMAAPLLDAACAGGRFRRVSIGVREHLVAVLEGSPCAASIVPIRKGSSEVGLLRELRPDAALLLTNSLGAAWRTFRAGVPLRAGAALSARGPLLTHRVVPPTRDGRRAPAPTRGLMADVCALVGIRAPEERLRLHVGEDVRAEARRLLAEGGLGPDEDYCVCSPAAAFGAAKSWPAEHHARVLDGLHERYGWRALLCGAPSEEPVLAAVASAARHPVIDLGDAPRTLPLLKAWIAGARLVLCSDSGPRWIAAAFDVPCVSLIGPNFPELTPPEPGSELLRVEGLECSPCIARRCPLGHHRCMTELAPERALEAAERLVGAGDAAR